MVNILIHQGMPGGAIVDADALEQFQKQWATYQKLVDTDSLSHGEVGKILRAALTCGFTGPFSLLDIACGDASLMRDVLPGTTIAQYHGVDLSEPALELAANNLATMPFEVALDHGDFIEEVEKRPLPADVSWCSLSVHHLLTDGKLELLKALHGSTRSVLMLYEPTRLDGETRDEYLQRFERINRPLWSMLDDEEWGQVWRHVSTCDFPETACEWLSLGREAGFGKATELFVDPTDFYRLYRYDR
jgi:hypothetical protein